jgi:hypothetical protein
MTPEQAALFREWLETKAQNALEDRRKWAQDRTNPKASSQWVNYSGDPAFAAGLAVAFHRAAEKLATIIQFDCPAWARAEIAGDVARIRTRRGAAYVRGVP